MQIRPVFVSAAAVIAACSLFAVNHAYAQDEADATLETVEIADGIFLLVGRGGNIGVSAGDDGVLLIDDQFAYMVPKVREAVAAITNAPIKMVLNTHWHGDHTGGNEALAQTDALIVAHDNVRVRMSSKHFNAFFNSTTEPSPPAALPVVTFDDTVTFHVNGHTIRAEHVQPAHTDGDAIVYFENANVVHMGDTYFNGFYPFIDGSSGGSVMGMIAAVDQALERMDESTRVIPGHGPLSDRAGLIAYRDMLNTVAGRVREGIDAGESVEEVVAAKPTAEFDEQWGQGFIKPDDWVALIYGIMAGND